MRRRRTSHEAVAEVILALGVIFDILPLEVGATTPADKVSKLQVM